MLFDTPVPAGCYIDFDGTITEVDVVDGLIEKFAQSGDWKIYERLWSEGSISSDVCMAKQLELVRVSPDEMHDYLKSIPLDKGFFELLHTLRSENVPLRVVSDGFDLFISEIFKIYGIQALPYISNKLVMRDGRVWPAFPWKDASCSRCGNCKRRILSRNRHLVGRSIFIGDGLSDICAVGESDILFAKRKLADYCMREEKSFVRFESLSDVARKIPEVLSAQYLC